MEFNIVSRRNPKEEERNLDCESRGADCEQRRPKQRRFTAAASVRDYLLRSVLFSQWIPLAAERSTHGPEIALSLHGTAQK